MNDVAPVDPKPITPGDSDPIPQSIHDIVTGIFDNDLGNGSGSLPLGNIPDSAPPGSNLFDQSPTAPIAPLANFDSDIDNLLKDIDSAQLTEGSEKSIASFEGLKTRYKNKIEQLKQQYQNTTTELETLRNTQTDFDSLKSKATVADELEQKLKEAKETLEAQTSELEEARYYRRKYDFENDPYVRSNYIAPMDDLRDKALDIISNAGKDEKLWESLRHSESEYEINELIDGSGIKGLNASSLKEILGSYVKYSAQLYESSRPEIIDAELSRIRGRGKTVIEDEGKKVFKQVQDVFKDHVEELQNSELNKEHNYFVRDKVVKDAEGAFGALVSSFNPELLTTQTLALLARTALVTAAYPVKTQMTHHLLKENADLKKALKEQTSGNPVTQIGEPQPRQPDIISAEQLLGLTPEQIAKSVLS